jgi:hypothetical protein
MLSDNQKNQGTYISHSYMSSVKYDNGVPQRESYKSSSVKQFDKEGRAIQEKKQAYENSMAGIKRAGFERQLDNKGHKVVKERKTRDEEETEHTYYKGIQEGK